MIINIVILACIILPGLVLLLLRSNAALVFLSLCLGSLLAQVASGDTSAVLGSVRPHGASLSLDTISLVLLLAPPILTAIFMARTTPTKHFLAQILPAFASGVAALLLSRQYLPPGIVKDLTLSPLWQKIDELEVIIVGVSALVCLLVVWMQRPGHSGGHAKNAD